MFDINVTRLGEEKQEEQDEERCSPAVHKSNTG